MRLSKKQNAIAVAVLGLAIASPTFAAPLADLHVEVETIIDTNVQDPFTAAGTAVDQGLFCPDGLVSDESVTIVNPQNTKTRILRIVKRFMCQNGTGTLDVNLLVHLDLNTHEATANWRITGGTGAYANVRGTGKLVGTPIEPGISIFDVYDGRLH